MLKVKNVFQTNYRRHKTRQCQNQAHWLDITCQTCFLKCYLFTAELSTTFALTYAET